MNTDNVVTFPVEVIDENTAQLELDPQDDPGNLSDVHMETVEPIN